MTATLPSQPTVPVADIPALADMSARFVRRMLDRGELGEVMPEPDGDVVLRSEYDDFMERHEVAVALVKRAFDPEEQKQAERVLLSRASGVSLDDMAALGF
jgi:hypothetical protein